jgi:pimeloyl-ACP methyl ester carboxylesterase
MSSELVAGGLSFRVLRSDGQKPGRAFLLVHGIGMSHRYLRRLHAELSSDGRVVSVDLPGFAGVRPPDGDVDIPTMAAALAALVDHLALRDVVLIGHSMGCQWVTELAVQRPDLASHVVLLGPVADDRHRTAFAQARALALDCLRESPTANWIVLTDYLRSGTRWYFSQLRHMLAYPTEERVGALMRPVLIVRGTLDPVAGLAWCRRLRDAAADAALVEVPRGPHVVQHRAPRAVAGAIGSFLAAGPTAMQRVSG